MLAHLFALFLGFLMPLDTPGGPIASIIVTNVPSVCAAAQLAPPATPEFPLG